MNLEKVTLEEQGLRDGIQSLDSLIPTEQKVDYIHRLVDAGLQRIQVASFVHPKIVPQMADAEKVCSLINYQEDVIYTGLVLNVKGVERAINTPLKHLACSISASSTHSEKNSRQTLVEAKQNFSQMLSLAKGNQMKVRGGIQCAFGCRYEGKIDQQVVLDLVDRYLNEGVDEIALADSTGMANPKDLRELLNQIVNKANNIPIILHLHNTENKGYANLYAALLAGVRIFDTAFGGLGGCPFIKSASGNIATEDTANSLRQMGYETGIDIRKVSQISKEMESHLGYPLPGMLYKFLDQDIQMI